MRSWSDYHAQEDPTEATVECAGLAVKERCNAEGVPSARQRAMCWKPSTWPRTAENRGWQEEVKTPLQESGRLAWMTIRGEEPSSSAGHRAPSSVTQGEGGEAEAAEELQEEEALGFPIIGCPILHMGRSSVTMQTPDRGSTFLTTTPHQSPLRI